MEIKKCYVAFYLLLSLFIFSACNDDDDHDHDNPITVMDMIDGTTLNKEYPYLYLSPFSSKKTFDIRGGDGQYDVLNLNEDVAEISYNGKWWELRVLSIGDATIKIFDNSGNVFDLYIRIDYPRKTFRIIQTFPYVKGDDLTIKQKKQLEEDIVKAIPVGTDGGRYEFTFTSKDAENEGEVVIYPSWSAKSRKGTFSVKRVSIGYQQGADQYTIKVDDEEWIFVDMPYFNPNTRALPIYHRMFTEDVTEKYKEEYPALEAAWAMQVYTIDTDY